MGDLTAHFSKSELACKCGCGLFVRDQKLIDLIEAIRVYINVPLRVNSGTRCQWWNAKNKGEVGVKYYLPGTKTYDLSRYPRGLQGGPKDSYHTQGGACDLSSAQMNSRAMHEKILELYKSGGIPNLGGLGLYITKNFCHVDIRPKVKGQIVRWTYS